MTRRKQNILGLRKVFMTEIFLRKSESKNWYPYKLSHTGVFLNQNQTNLFNSFFEWEYSEVQYKIVFRIPNADKKTLFFHKPVWVFTFNSFICPYLPFLIKCDKTWYVINWIIDGPNRRAIGFSLFGSLKSLNSTDVGPQI